MKSRSNINWKPDDNQRLVEMVETGVTAARASVIFKRSITAVQNQARKLGKRFPTLNDAKRARNSKIKAAEQTL